MRDLSQPSFYSDSQPAEKKKIVRHDVGTANDDETELMGLSTTLPPCWASTEHRHTCIVAKLRLYWMC